MHKAEDRFKKKNHIIIKTPGVGLMEYVLADQIV